MKTKSNREKNRIYLEKKRKDKRNNVNRIKDNETDDTSKRKEVQIKGIREVPSKHVLKTEARKVNPEKRKSVPATEKETIPAEPINIKTQMVNKMLEKIGQIGNEFFIRNVVGDGACGFRCIALHCTHDEGEFRRIRKYINKFIIHHWELLELKNFYGGFKNGIKFNVGNSTEKFKSQIEFLCFLDSDKADLLWMDHADLQMASNTFKFTIKVLDIALNEPTWTEIKPDARFKDHTCPVCDLTM